MTRKSKGAPFQMRSGNATPFKNMASSYVQPADSPIQEGDSPMKQAWLIKKAIKYTPRVTKYVKGLFSKSDEMTETVKKVEKGLKNPKGKKVTVKPKTNTKTNTKKTVDHTKRNLDIKVEKPVLDKRTKGYKDAYKAGKESVEVVVPKAKGLSTTKKALIGVGVGTAATKGYELGSWAWEKFLHPKADPTLTLDGIGGYLDKENKIITSEGDTLDLSKNVIKKGDY